MKNKTKTKQSIPSGVNWLQEEVWRAGLVILRVVKELIEELLKVEVKEVVQADHYERDFPKEMWTKIRSTNILERAFREIRRRTRSMEFCQMREVLTGLCMRLLRNSMGIGHFQNLHKKLR